MRASHPWTTAAVGVTLAVISVRADAQGAAQPVTKEFTVAAVGVAGRSLGSSPAVLETPGGSGLTLFSTTNRLGAGSGMEAHLGVRLRPRWWIEVSGSWVRADLMSRVSLDFEGVTPLSLSTGTHQFTVEGAVIRRFARRGRLDPFARVSAGWMRQLTSDRVFLEDGLIVNAGGGVRYWLRERGKGLFGRLAVRVDARLAIRRGGMSLGASNTVIAPAFVAGLVIGR